MTDLKPIASAKQVGRQTNLFPENEGIAFSSPNHASPYLGDWAEEYASAVTGGERLITDANAVCPDLKLGPDWFAEVKAIGPRNCFTMYRGRYEKYFKLAKTCRLHFIFVHHDVQASELTSLFHLRRSLAVRVQHITIVPAATVFKEVRRLMEEWGSWRYAGGRAAPYQYYHRLGGEWLDQFRLTKPHRPLRAYRCRVYDDDVGYVPARIYKTKLPEARVGIHPPEIQRAAGEMLADLKSQNHIVALVPCEDGRKKRVVVERNVDWYERLCDEHRGEKYRRSTLIQRRNVINALKQMEANRPVAPGVEEKLLPYVDAWVEDTEEIPF